MKKTTIALCMISILIMSVGFVMAVSAKNQNQKQDNAFSLPKNAVEVAPGVFYLGKAMDKGRVVEGYALMMKNKKEFAKDSCGDGKCHPVFEDAGSCPADCEGVPDPEDPEEPDTSSCYTFLARGAKWKTTENYIVNTDNGEGLTRKFITDNLALDIGKWEIAGSYNILGDEVTGIVDGIDLVTPDNKNEVLFGDIDPDGVIGMTIIWGVFGGRPSARRLVEWDMIFNDVDFDWSAIGEVGKMDFENIATHELGHAVGLGDLYNTECNTQTMYGYASYGETSKRTLESGDIAGISSLY